MLKSKNSQTLNRLMNTTVGEELLAVLREEYGGSTYCKGDPVHTAFREGARDVVLYLDEVKNDTSK